MSAQEVGEHDPMVFAGSMLGVWIECECGWISPGYYTETNALKAHEKHVSKVVTP